MLMPYEIGLKVDEERSAITNASPKVISPPNTETARTGICFRRFAVDARMANVAAKG